MWYEWDSLDDFNAWHNAIKVELGLPKPGIVQDSSEVNEDAQWTTDYVLPIQVNGKFIAQVEEAHAESLTPTDLRPVTPEIL